MHTVPTPPDPTEPMPAAASPRPPHAGRALAGVLFVWTLAIVLLVTLAPFRLCAPDHLVLDLHAGGAFELAVNCCLLAVPGFLLRAATGTTRDAYCVVPLVVGAVLAAGIELAQSCIPGRVPSPVDVAANAAGAWFGAMTFDAARRNLDLRLADRLLLELPLMGLVYLLVPLLWLAGEAAAEDGRRLVLTLPLGVMGGSILAAVWRHRLRPVAILSPARVAIVAAAWFVVAAAPALRHRPAWLAVGTILVAAATRWAATSRGFMPADGRRFEGPVLRRVGPLFVAYLVVLAGWPWRFDAGTWRTALVPPEIGSPPTLGAVYRVVEHFAAFTLGGYLLAESRGRRDESVVRALGGTVLPVAAFATALELLRGFAPGYGATLLRPVLAVAGATLGAVVYRRQLAAVRAWLAHRAHAAASGEVREPAPPSGVPSDSGGRGAAEVRASA